MYFNRDEILERNEELLQRHETEKARLAERWLDVATNPGRQPTGAGNCVCLRTEFNVRPPVLPPARKHRDGSAAMPLVSVLSPTSSERHWAHPNLYRCFQQQDYPNKELLVLDTGERPSPFFDRITDPRVRYFHIGIVKPNLLELVQELRRFVAAAEQPPGTSSGNDRGEGGQTQGRRNDDFGGATEWSEAWAGAVDAIKRVCAGKEWYELEDEGHDSPHYLSTMSAVLSLGAKRNWLSSQARGAILANFDDDDVYCNQYLSRMVSAMQASDAGLCKLASFLYLDILSVRQRVAGDQDACSGSGLRTGDEDSGGQSSGCSGRYKLYHCDVDEFSHADKDLLSSAALFGNIHGIRWGYGFSCVHTAELARECPYPHTNFGEDCACLALAAMPSPWKRSCHHLPPTTQGVHMAPLILSPPLSRLSDAMVHLAAKSGFKCMCFNSTLGDAAALHIGHSKSSSSVSFGRAIPLHGPEASVMVSASSADATVAENVALDRCFCSPVSSLVDAVAKDYLQALVAESERRRQEFNDLSSRVQGTYHRIMSEAVDAVRDLSHAPGVGGRVESSVAHASRSIKALGYGSRR